MLVFRERAEALAALRSRLDFFFFSSELEIAVAVAVAVTISCRRRRRRHESGQPRLRPASRQGRAPPPAAAQERRGQGAPRGGGSVRQRAAARGCRRSGTRQRRRERRRRRRGRSRDECSQVRALRAEPRADAARVSRGGLEGGSRKEDDALGVEYPAVAAIAVAVLAFLPKHRDASDGAPSAATVREERHLP